PCAIAHSALKIIYANEWHPFYYIALVCSKNKHAHQRAVNEMGLWGYPTVFWDGGYKTNMGASSIEDALDTYNNSIIKCGERNVKNIDLSLNVEWHGAVNNDPKNGETEVPIEKILCWTISEMAIDVEVTNNETSQYNGHLHVYVTEVNSTMWNDNYGNPYTFAFLDYAFNQDVTLSTGGEWSDSINWDGMDYDDGYGNYFKNIIQDNIMVVAAIFDEDNDDYVDETTGFLAGDGTDPKTFDVYFGDVYPPPKIVSNTSSMTYPPHDKLNWTTTYYWKINVWDALDNLIEGDVWSFTTRGNTAPNPPYPIEPEDGDTGVPIDTNLTWNCIDPEDDDLEYEIYFGEFDPFADPPLVESHYTDTTYDPTPFGTTLKFNTKYAWMINVTEEYGEKSSGGVWTFTTEPNYPPDPAHDEIPPNGASNVPGNATLFWNGTDPNSGDELKYDVYFSISYPPILVSENQTEPFYDPYGPSDMPLFQKYYWKIVTWDKEGEDTSSQDWSFQTGLNPEPTNPEIDGPTNGVPNVDYNFTFISEDIDNNTIKYYIDWADETTTETGYYKIGEVVDLTHNWTKVGDYKISAQAEDNYGAKSGRSYHTINIPRSRTVNLNVNLFSWLFEQFPILVRLLNLIRVI
ncbi:MAG: hypothetical protein ACFFBZ_16465, partial [Promethearchaeota archaeon]